MKTTLWTSVREFLSYEFERTYKPIHQPLHLRHLYLYLSSCSPVPCAASGSWTQLSSWPTLSGFTHQAAAVVVHSRPSQAATALSRNGCLLYPPSLGRNKGRDWVRDGDTHPLNAVFPPSAQCAEAFSEGAAGVSRCVCLTLLRSV